jgi:hypothetical protein
MEHLGYNGSSYGVKNNLKTYQKQEFTEDLGLNTHEWKYRVSDPATGRFWQIDPLSEDYVYNSTYAFQENKLGMGTELEGLEVNYFYPQNKEQLQGGLEKNEVEGGIVVAFLSLFTPGPDEVLTAGIVGKLANVFIKAKKVEKTAEKVKTIDKVEDVMKNRVKLRKGTKEAIKDAAPKTKDGRFIDPNTFKPIEKGEEVFGHKTGQEWSKYKKDPANKNKTRKEVIEDQNDPNKYQIEDRKSNASHKFEEKSNGKTNEG